jgi:uncharacterized protein (TIGR03085 family)
MTYARDERLALCTLLDDSGPGAPTLCQGWRTVDLAAHLVLRERRPDAGAGLLGGPLARYTRRVQSGLAGRTPYPRLVEMIRTGPPRLSPFSLPGVDERANLAEYFVHHEDVRRARPGWEPRKLDAGESEALWKGLRMARFVLRKAPVGVEFARLDPPESGAAGQSRVRITAKARAPVVTVTGTPAELFLWVAGRTAACRVQLDGSEADVRALTAASWHL